jgi:hypothetical protein
VKASLLTPKPTETVPHKHSARAAARRLQRGSAGRAVDGQCTFRCAALAPAVTEEEDAATRLQLDALSNKKARARLQLWRGLRRGPGPAR